MSLPICPDDCTSALPEVSFDKCAPEINNAQIEEIFITNEGDSCCMTDWTDPLEWVARLSQDSVVACSIRRLCGIGEFTDPTSTEKEISCGRKIQSVKEFRILFDIDETNAINHEMVRSMECSGQYKLWFKTRDGLLFGGNCGMDGFLKINMNISRSYEDHIIYKAEFTWKAKFHPERIVSPIAEI